MENKVNYYGSLCTEMYELLHPQAPQDELEFYLSYAKQGDKVLELLCGSGRFFVPFLQKGFDITGVDLSREMLDKLLEKEPTAKVHCCGADQYETKEQYDYIFISSNSFSLFTDRELAKSVLRRAKELLAQQGRFVFAVDTVHSAENGDGNYHEVSSVKTKEGFLLKLKMCERYDAANQIQYYPSVYELWDGEQLLQNEQMDFQTRLYRLGDLDELLKQSGFAGYRVYSGFEKTAAENSNSGTLLYECW